MDFLIKSAAHIPGIIEKIKRVLQSWSAFPGKRKAQSGALALLGNRNGYLSAAKLNCRFCRRIPNDTG